LSIAIIALEVYLVDDYKKALNLSRNSWHFGALMPLLMMVFFFLARAGISKDEKLVKSLDRLRD
jgi:hypothetical protein